MRTIKFRGKRISDDSWVYGCLLTTDFGDVYIRQTNFGSHGYMTFGVHPETVGQFTGLHDKDGNEIYEGDYVNYTNPYNHNHYIHKIFWDEKWACFALFNNLSFFAQESDWVKIKIGSVQGNIHDNPELIKEDEK